MLAALVLAFAVVAQHEALEAQFETQEILSASGRTKLVVGVPWRAPTPTVFEVSCNGRLLWRAEQPHAFELATVDDRGCVAAMRWTRLIHLRPAYGEARGDGEILCFDSSGVVRARKNVCRDEGWGCMTQGGDVFDLLLLEDGLVLLRASPGAVDAGGFGETWSLFRTSNLERLSLSFPGDAHQRPKTPLWLPDAFGRPGEPALDVRVVPDTSLLVIRWPLPEWRPAGAGVQLVELFTVVDASAQPVLEIALPVDDWRADVDLSLDLAKLAPRTRRHVEWFQPRGTQQFALRRSLDDAWIDAWVVSTDGRWSAGFDLYR